MRKRKINQYLGGVLIFEKERTDSRTSPIELERINDALVKLWNEFDYEERMYIWSQSSV